MQLLTGHLNQLDPWALQNQHPFLLSPNLINLLLLDSSSMDATSSTQLPKPDTVYLPRGPSSPLIHSINSFFLFCSVLFYYVISLQQIQFYPTPLFLSGNTHNLSLCLEYYFLERLPWNSFPSQFLPFTFLFKSVLFIHSTGHNFK